MTECSAQLSFRFHPQQRIDVRFDGPEISSDGGALLIRQLDDQLGVTAGIARLLRDERDPRRVVHSHREQIRQRVFQVIQGYEDANDADRLRHDPVLLTVCDRLPDDAQGLSSQPTLSRLENSVSRWALSRLVRWFECEYVRSLPADTEVVVLDIDATEDRTYGQQELAFFHGYFDQSIYHPLLVFDGDSGQLVTALLRPGRAHASHGARRTLRRLIRRIKRRFPQAQIAVRGDSHFAMPRILDELERLDRELGGIDYLLGLARNRALERRVEPALAAAQAEAENRGVNVERWVRFDYRARRWKCSRVVVARAEHSTVWGANPRFVITSLSGFDPETLYRAYSHRGQCENRIKDLKNALAADRLSCSRFVANAFRLLLHAAAYRLLHALRDRVAQVSSRLGRAQLDTLRLRLLKVAAIVQRSARRIWIRLPRGFPEAQIFRQVALHGTGPPNRPSLS